MELIDYKQAYLDTLHDLLDCLENAYIINYNKDEIREVKNKIAEHPSTSDEFRDKFKIEYNEWCNIQKREIERAIENNHIECKRERDEYLKSNEGKMIIENEER